MFKGVKHLWRDLLVENKRYIHYVLLIDSKRSILELFWRFLNLDTPHTLEM